MPSWVITGTSRGIGLEFVRQLSANEQNTVFAIVRSKATAQRLIDLSASNIHILEAELTDHEAIKVAAEEVAKITGGTLDYLINNAAWQGNERTPSTLSQYDDPNLLSEDLNLAFKNNVVGLTFTINAFLPLLRKGTTKKVLTLSSGVADPNFLLAAEYAINVPYGVSKAALNLVVTAYAAELKEEGFVFLALSPGLVNTKTGPLTPEEQEIFNGLWPKFQKAEPDARVITPEESVKLQLGLLDRWTVEDTGAFVSHHGTKKWL